MEGISGGFPDCVPVIIQMEAGCWMGCCMIGRVFKDVEKPKSVTGDIQNSTPHHKSTLPKCPRLDYATGLSGLASKTAVEASEGAREHQRHGQTARAGDQDMTPTTELEVPDPLQEQIRKEEVRRAPQDVDPCWR